MVRKAVHSVTALLAVVVLGFAVTPGCVIKLGTGGIPDETEETSGNGEGGEGGGQGGMGGVVEDPFKNADVVEVNRQGLKASAAAYLLQGTLDQEFELQGLDPDNTDVSTVNQLIDDTWPSSLAQAEAWISTLDSTLFEAEIKPPSTYCASLGCPTKMYCDSAYYKKTITCYQQACGDAGCTSCPDWFGPLKHLVITAWCSYVCIEGDMVVGSAATVITRWDNYQRCILP